MVLSSPSRSREFKVIFLHYLMHFEKVFLITLPSQIVSEIFNVFCETFSSKNKVWFGLVRLGLIRLDEVLKCSL